MVNSCLAGSLLIEVCSSFLISEDPVVSTSYCAAKFFLERLVSSWEYSLQIWGIQKLLFLALKDLFRCVRWPWDLCSGHCFVLYWCHVLGMSLLFINLIHQFASIWLPSSHLSPGIGSSQWIVSTSKILIKTCLYDKEFWFASVDILLKRELALRPK